MTFRDLLGLARPQRGRLLIIGALMLAESLALLLVPAVAGPLAAGLLASADFDTGALAALILAALAAAAALRALVAILLGGAAARLLTSLRTTLHDHLQALPLAFHQAHRKGDLLAILAYEVLVLSNFLTGTLVGIVPSLVTALGAVVLMARIDLALALVVPILIPVFILVLKVLGRRLRRLSQDIQQAQADLMATADEDLEVLPAIKAFTRETASSARFAARASRLLDLTLQELRIQGVTTPLLGFLAATAAVAVLLLAGQGVREGTIDPAGMVSFLLYAVLLTRPATALADLYGRVQQARGALARVGEVLGTPPEPGLAVAGRLGSAQGAIAFEAVSFSYPERAPALHGIDLQVGPGEIVALTGDNGAGKSTLVALLLRFHDPSAGRILLDGRDIARVHVRDLRRQIGLVPQQPLLFNGTIRDNIAFGAEDASAERVVHAAHLAQAQDFIAALPQGYDTVIGDRGVRLSGGQGQRVALARALVKDPAVLILDEATSMYDLDGESAFVAAAATSLKGRTVLLITHRPATLALAHRIITLREGRVIAERVAA